MHHENLVHLPTGGRRSSPKFRETLALSDEFQGLPENVTHFDILKLVKRVGRELGMTERMIQLLEYYLLFTRDQDWSANARPIVYQSLYKTARDFGVGERQIQKLEQTLFEIGALTWQDSGNHKRYGMRDEDSGDILFAYGVDLSPLASLYPLLLQKYEEKQIRDAAWMDTKRQISGTRARIRALITELPAEEQEKAHTHYLTIAYSIRAHMSLESLRELLGKHMEMRETLQQRLSESARAEDNHVQKTYIYTSKDASLGAHKYSTKNTPSDKSDTCSHEDISFQESVAAGLEGK
ncbi:MAG: hypothetical protein KDI90_12435, partial [Alphaproteobacteria bacterium]|nr:hypothetical protein [Alphaproteobacteria bacterium]